MKNLRIAKAALTETIYAGRISKDGRNFIGDKLDVTSDVLKAIIDYVEPGHEITVREAGVPKWTIAVREIKAANSVSEPSPEEQSTYA